MLSESEASVCSFEWEKRWHPEIEEPEVALPVFVQVLRAAEAQTDML